MKNKVCVVTGATSGIGWVTVRQLVELGATVVVIGRNPRKTARVVECINRSRYPGRAEGLVADLSSQRQVRRVAEEFKARHRRLDVLVNNAGAWFLRRAVTEDGWEMTLGLNHASYFLLTNLLLDLLRDAAPSRVVNVASCAHERGRIDFDDLQSEHHYERMIAYAQSKLANVLFTYALTRRLEHTGVTANALHPGFVATNLGANDSWIRTKLRNLLKRSYISPEEGARTSVYLATAPEVANVSGRYFHRCAPVPSSAASHDEEVGERLWAVTAEHTGVSDR